MDTYRLVAKDRSSARSKRLHIALWLLQGMLAVLFAMAGATKVATPVDELFRQMPTLAGMSKPMVRFIGISEVAGGLGLILPAATRILPRLVVLAAAGLSIVMVLAALHHFSRGELSSVPFTLVLAGLAAFVAWGRWRGRPIEPCS